MQALSAIHRSQYYSFYEWNMNYEWRGRPFQSSAHPPFLDPVFMEARILLLLPEEVGGKGGNNSDTPNECL